uniref:hypothetical protein n=1 Tax=Alloprevotella tannerae TaxID=76122 RepID=UPI0025DBED84
WLSCFVVKTKINQKAEVQLRTSALFYVERKTFTGQQYPEKDWEACLKEAAESPQMPSLVD